MAFDTSWANFSNVTHVLEYGLAEFTTYIPRDIFFSFIIAILTIGIYLGSGNLKLPLLFMILSYFFFGVVMSSVLVLVFCIVSALIGAYALYKSYLN